MFSSTSTVDLWRETQEYLIINMNIKKTKIENEAQSTISCKMPHYSDLAFKTLIVKGFLTL